MTYYGFTVMRRRIGLQPSMGIPMMRIRDLQLVPVIRKERRSLSRKTSTEEIVMIEDMMDQVIPVIETEGIIRKCNASVAKSLVTSGEIALRRRVSREHLEQRLTMSPRGRETRLHIHQIQSSFSFHLFQV